MASEAEYSIRRNELFQSFCYHGQPKDYAKLKANKEMALGMKEKKTYRKQKATKLSVKRGAPSEKAGKKPAAKKGKAAKDPNKPKRPASAFFFFMEEFRKMYKEKHPNNKSVAAVGKAGGDKWKSLSEAEKAPYVAKAEKRKTEYNKTLEAYNKKKVKGPADEEESDKLRSEVNDEDDEDEDDESGEIKGISLR
ncbi:high mobility group B protein 3-like [Camellia sinensis]|uniref:high mobility group B protein 3-like n=1 Tax=Camellia sinensis TaxID=4442 RepID=UPI001036325F|nr:high mobility group B protein 3-like [Camellia sinensis]